jgi:hypothetical protein
MVGWLILAERHGGVGAIDARSAGVGKVSDLGMPACLEDVGEGNDVALHIGMRILNRVAHAGLSGEVDDAVELVGGKAGVDGRAVRKVGADECIG